MATVWYLVQNSQEPLRPRTMSLHMSTSVWCGKYLLEHKKLPQNILTGMNYQLLQQLVWTNNNFKVLHIMNIYQQKLFVVV